MKNLLAIWLVLLFALSGTLFAKEYTTTSFYVAYDSADVTQFALVMPSVEKAATHKAGHILPADLKQVDSQFISAPTYNNGELCFSDLKSGATGKNGASIMKNKCYKVNFFYTEKEVVSGKGVCFLLVYVPSDTVYEGLAGDKKSFKVVKKGDTIMNENSITGTDYVAFSFDIKKGSISIGDKSNRLPVVDAGKDRTVEPNETIIINGTATDMDGSIISYIWTKDGKILANTSSFSYTPKVEGIEISAKTLVVNELIPGKNI